MALAQACAAYPVFPLRLICCESALHAWLNAEEKLDPINRSSMFLCCFRVVRVRIPTNTQAGRSRRSGGFVRVLTALFQNATNSQPTPDDVPAPRISMAHLPHVAASSRTPQPPTSISVDQNIIGAIATSAPRRRTDHGHPLQSMCSRDSVWHSVAVHEDFDAVPTLPPILHTCPRSPWKTTRTECCSNAARRTSCITAVTRGTPREC